MYEYSNTAYNSQPASVENIPQRWTTAAKPPTGDSAKTVGIGYYGVRKNTQSADQGLRNIASPISPTGSTSTRELGSPMDNQSHLQSTFNSNTKNTDYNDSWNYMDANMDLSSAGHVPRSSTRERLADTNNLRSPSRPLSEGSIVDSYTRNRLSPAGQNQSMTSGTVSTDRSDANQSGSTLRQDRTLSHSAPTVDTTRPTVMSLREKWEIGRKAREDQGPYSGYSYTPVRKRDVVSPYGGEGGSRHRQASEDNIASPTPTHYSRQSAADTINRSVFSGTTMDRSAQSTMERDNTNYSTGSLRRDPLTHRKLPNGVARPVRNGSLNASRRSLSWSRLSLKSHGGRVTIYGKGYGVHNSLVNMALAAILSLVMSILAIQLLFRVSAPQTQGLHTQDSVLSSNVSYYNVSEVVVSLSCITLMLDLCCLLTCSMQGYFAAKLIKCSQGEERAFRYLKECMPTRFISIIGFFISIPVFFFAVMLYVLMEYRSTPAIIAVVVLTIGVSFLVSMTVHSTYIWLAEKSSANAPAEQISNNNNKKKRTKVINGELTNQNELSTLV